MAINLEDFASGGPWGFAWPGCCCETECWDWQDFFTDPHDDPEALCRAELEYWEVIYPEPPDDDSWWIELNTPFCTLVEEGTQGATILCTEQVPKGPLNNENTLTSRFARIDVTIHDDEVGDTYSILMDWFWLDKAELVANYLEFRYYRQASDVAILSLYSYIDGVETELESCQVTPTDPAGTGVWMSACVSKGTFYGTAVGATVMTPAVNTFDDDVDDLGFFFGLRHNNTHESIWSDWYMYQLIDDHPDCPFCGVCQCGYNCEGPVYPIPPRLLVTWVGYDDGCGNCDDCTGVSGNTLVLEGAECDYDINNAVRDYVWVGIYGEDSDCFPPSGGIERWIVLNCGPRPRDPCDPCDPFGPCEPPTPAWGWELEVNRPSPNNYPYPCLAQDGDITPDMRIHSSADSTCNPFMLVFDVDFEYPGPPPGLGPNCGVPDSPCNPCGGSTSESGEDWFRIHYRIIITEAAEEEEEISSSG